MKKLTKLLLVLTCLSFNIIPITPTFAAISFTEGIYKLSDFNNLQGDNYTIQNTSDNDSVYMIIFDENQHELQSIHLSPKSLQYKLIPLEPNYRIVIVGTGNVIIS